MERLLPLAATLFLLWGCKNDKNNHAMGNVTENPRPGPTLASPFIWEAANVYFMLVDRFNNGNTDNDINFNRTAPTGLLRNFMGGDLQGVTQKIKAGYFSDLGINAIWITPIIEQIHGSVDESTGNTYGYHGYWAKDWTALDPNFGTAKDMEELVDTAHAHGIRILLDVVLNHTGPVTDQDPAWPLDWVRTGPECQFTDYETTTNCTLVRNLPDILSESDQPVEIPDLLMAKWKEEGRLSTELDELQLFFNRTGYPRTPRYFLIKWLTDYIHDFGVDGFRVDTAKHVNEDVWKELRTEADYAFSMWKQKHQDKVLDENPFFMVGEVYNYGISGGRFFDFGDRKVDYFDHGFNSLVNFELKRDAHLPYDSIFSKYGNLLHGELKGMGVLNYLASHDDGDPYDKDRTKPYRAANVLLLTPGTSQVYYGDETARSLTIEGTQGDATLRSFMNWDELKTRPETKDILAYWQKLGRFRHDHPAIGAGTHHRLSESPYVFSRSYVKDGYEDHVVIGLDLPPGAKSIPVKGVFAEGSPVLDAFSGTETIVKNGKLALDSGNGTVLLELLNNGRRSN